MKSLGEIFGGLIGKHPGAKAPESDADAIARRLNGLEAIKGSVTAQAEAQGVAPAVPTAPEASPVAQTPLPTPVK